MKKTVSKDQNPHNHSACCGDSSVETIKQESMQTLETVNAHEIITTFKVANMDCADEIKAIQDALKFPGVIKIQANLMSSTVQVLHSNEVEVSLIKKKIHTTVVRVISKNEDELKQLISKRIILVFFSGLFLILALVMQWLKTNSTIENSLFILSALMGGSLIFPKAISSLKRLALDMNVLMTIAAIGAVIIRQYSEASAVIFLFSLSELLESLSVQRARQAIQALFKIAPKTANRLDDNDVIQKVNVEDIAISQIVRVKPGENIPLDGIIISGSSAINQAPLTGEFIPVSATIGTNVFAGTINQEGILDIKVTKVFKDTKISQVIRLVEEAQGQRANSQKFIDSFAQYYTPIVFLFAILTFLLPPLFFHGEWSYWFYKSLVMLVIACPCALVISTPITIVSSLTALIRKGVLVKGGAVLEMLAKIKVLAIDKTGTLTKGMPTVHEMKTFAPFTEKALLEICASLEQHSSHPLARAIVEYTQNKNIRPMRIENFINISGYGIEGFLDGHIYILGNKKFINELKIGTDELEKILREYETKNYSVIIVAHKPHQSCKGEIMGVIALGDQLREDARSSIEQIKAVGISKIVMLSGDNQQAANAVGKAVGIEEISGNLLPGDKLNKIESLLTEYNFVAMIGDGINDAPAMARSSLGIAMGAMGSDAAIETADMTLMNDDLSQVAIAIKTAKRTLSVIKFNIIFALITKLIFIILTFFGYANLWLAVAADTGATLLVILNSLRLLRLS